MPTLALILERTSAAYGLRVRQVATRRPVPPVAQEAQAVFAYLATHLTDASDSIVGSKIGLDFQSAGQLMGEVEGRITEDPAFGRRLDRLSLEIHTEALAAAALKLPLPADPDPARTAAQLLAGGPAAATVSEDALRGLALAFLALAAGSPSTAVHEASDHAQGQG